MAILFIMKKILKKLRKLLSRKAEDRQNWCLDQETESGSQGPKCLQTPQNPTDDILQLTPKEKLEIEGIVLYYNLCDLGLHF